MASTPSHACPVVGTQHMLVMAATPSASFFAFTILMLESDCPLLWNFRGKHEGCSLPPTPSSKILTSDTIPLVMKATTRTQGHIVNMTTHSSVCELRVKVQEKGEQVSFQKNRREE